MNNIKGLKSVCTSRCEGEAKTEIPFYGVNPKSQAPNPNLLVIIGLIFVKCIIIGSNSNTVYDLDQKTFIFAKNVREYVENLPKNLTNAEIGRQLIRSAGSVGANYIEVDEALTEKISFTFSEISWKAEAPNKKRNYQRK